MAAKSTSKKRWPAPSNKSLVQAAMDAGALGAKVVDPRTVETAEWVRWKCRFGCGGYGASLVCPPHSPKPAETRAMLDGFTRGVLFESPSQRTKKIAATLERRFFLDGRYKALGLGAGPCMLCDVCAFDEGCRHPREARPAMEACGIDVFTTARRHGFEVEVARTRRDPQHYFGLVLVD